MSAASSRKRNTSMPVRTSLSLHSKRDELKVVRLVDDDTCLGCQPEEECSTCPRPSTSVLPSSNDMSTRNEAIPEIGSNLTSLLSRSVGAHP